MVITCVLSSFIMSSPCVFFQFSMPISSSPVNMLSVWCRAAWEKTHQFTSLSAPPWCTQRRRSLNKDASLSSITLTVSQAFLLLPPQCPYLLLFVLFPLSFTHFHFLLLTFFPTLFRQTIFPTMLLFPFSLNHFLITSYQAFFCSPLVILLISFHTPSL